MRQLRTPRLFATNPEEVSRPWQASVCPDATTTESKQGIHLYLSRKGAKGG